MPTPYKCTAHIKGNQFYKAMAFAAASIKSKKLTLYFATKWARSMKYKIDDGPWNYVDREAVFEWK